MKSIYLMSHAEFVARLVVEADEHEAETAEVLSEAARRISRIVQFDLFGDDNVQPALARRQAS